MEARLTFLRATDFEAKDDLSFGDGAMSERGRQDAAAVAVLPPYTRTLRTPSTRCAQTAEALGVQCDPEAALRDIDCGTWSGRTFREVAAREPYGLSAWLTDPDATPHGGESVAQLCRRTAAWLDALPDDGGHVLVITEKSVVRASLVHVLSAPARAFWHLDGPPLVPVTLTRRDGQWTARFDHPRLQPRRQQLPDLLAA
ncbi:histidine phosphatase family protein [Actinacidiphila glaucinigra]|uniref:histidine phosphatase family protein n=1 Tax=Actinacidiphila glaucinigra TaxID=235986 RepID=UPI0033AF745A